MVPVLLLAHFSIVTCALASVDPVGTPPYKKPGINHPALTNSIPVTYSVFATNPLQPDASMRPQVLFTALAVVVVLAARGSDQLE